MEKPHDPPAGPGRSSPSFRLFSSTPPRPAPIGTRRVRKSASAPSRRAPAAQSVPEGVLHAISLTETGRARNGRLRPWPWAINREGKGYWFATREEALAFARESVAAGRTSFDVGCFQINYFWHGRNFPSLESMFDPDTGADYAAAFCATSTPGAATGRPPPAPITRRAPTAPPSIRARFDRILAGLDGAPLMLAASQPEAPEAVSPPRKQPGTRRPTARRSSTSSRPEPTPPPKRASACPARGDRDPRAAPVAMSAELTL